MKDNPARTNGLCRVCRAPENAMCADECWLRKTIQMVVDGGGERSSVLAEKINDLEDQLEATLTRALRAESSLADLASHLRGCRPCR